MPKLHWAKNRLNVLSRLGLDDQAVELSKSVNILTKQTAFVAWNTKNKQPIAQDHLYQPVFTPQSSKTRVKFMIAAAMPTMQAAPPCPAAPPGLGTPPEPRPAAALGEVIQCKVNRNSNEETFGDYEFLRNLLHNKILDLPYHQVFQLDKLEKLFTKKYLPVIC